VISNGDTGDDDDDRLFGGNRAFDKTHSAVISNSDGDTGDNDDDRLLREDQYFGKAHPDMISYSDADIGDNDDGETMEERQSVMVTMADSRPGHSVIFEGVEVQA
jgi:hypothetical protein